MTEAPQKVTDSLLFETCPKTFIKEFKKCKTAAKRADFLGQLDKSRLEVGKYFKSINSFQNMLEEWFIQNLPMSDAKGITGQRSRVEIKKKDIATVMGDDWTTFYAHIKKTGAFELLNKAINQKAVQERWAQHKEVPGVTKFTRKVVSLTTVKSK